MNEQMKVAELLAHFPLWGLLTGHRGSVGMMITQ